MPAGAVPFPLSRWDQPGAEESKRSGPDDGKALREDGLLVATRAVIPDGSDSTAVRATKVAEVMIIGYRADARCEVLADGTLAPTSEGGFTIAELGTTYEGECGTTAAAAQRYGALQAASRHGCDALLRPQPVLHLGREHVVPRAVIRRGQARHARRRHGSVSWRLRVRVLPLPPDGHRALSHDCRPRSAIPARSTKPLIATSANGHEVAFVPIAALVPHDINVTGCQSKIEILRCAANAVASLQCAVPHLACA